MVRRAHVHACTRDTLQQTLGMGVWGGGTHTHTPSPTKLPPNPLLHQTPLCVHTPVLRLLLLLLHQTSPTPFNKPQTHVPDNCAHPMVATAIACLARDPPRMPRGAPSATIHHAAAHVGPQPDWVCVRGCQQFAQLSKPCATQQFKCKSVLLRVAPAAALTGTQTALPSSVHRLQIGIQPMARQYQRMRSILLAKCMWSVSC